MKCNVCDENIDETWADNIFIVRPIMSETQKYSSYGHDVLQITTGVERCIVFHKDCFIEIAGLDYLPKCL